MFNIYDVQMVYAFITYTCVLCRGIVLLNMRRQKVPNLLWNKWMVLSSVGETSRWAFIRVLLLSTFGGDNTYHRLVVLIMYHRQRQLLLGYKKKHWSTLVSMLLPFILTLLRVMCEGNSLIVLVFMLEYEEWSIEYEEWSISEHLISYCFKNWYYLCLSLSVSIIIKYGST